MLLISYFNIQISSTKSVSTLARTPHCLIKIVALLQIKPTEKFSKTQQIAPTKNALQYLLRVRPSTYRGYILAPRLDSH